MQHNSFWCSDREVHKKHKVLPDLQLCQQDHSSFAVSMHSLQIPTPGRKLCQKTAGWNLWRRRVSPLYNAPYSPSPCLMPSRSKEISGQSSVNWELNATLMHNIGSDAGRKILSLVTRYECFDSVCRVKLGKGGLDALATLGAGDMRRSLNILQVNFLIKFRSFIYTLFTIRPWGVTESMLDDIQQNHH